MINRELVDATVETYGGYDEYGQQLAEKTAERNITVAIGYYTHSATDDIRYQDVKYYGLTKDRNITDKDYIIVGENKYKVMFVNPTTRWTQLYLC